MTFLSSDLLIGGRLLQTRAMLQKKLDDLTAEASHISSEICRLSTSLSKLSADSSSIHRSLADLDRREAVYLRIESSLIDFLEGSVSEYVPGSSEDQYSDI